MKLDPKAARAAIERARARAPSLPGDPILAIAKARADMPKQASFKTRLASMIGRGPKDDFADMRELLMQSVADRPAALALAEEKMPVDPPEVAYLQHRRLGAA